MLSGLPRAWDLHFAREVDRASSESFQIEPLILMERAGLAVAEAAFKIASDFDVVLILAGTGNNGGDGLVAARELHRRGIDARCFIISRSLPAKYSDACRRQKQILEALSIRAELYQYGKFQEFKNQRCLIVDAILGIGFVPPLEDGPVLDALREASTLADKHVIAVDIPSGLNADGWNSSCILAADQTISFGGPKPCHLVAPSQKWCGNLVIADPGFPSQAQAMAEKQFPARLRIAEIGSLSENPTIRKLAVDAHKYDRGHILIMGGSTGKWGAPILSGIAAARSGAGWITIATESDPPEGLVDPSYPELCFERIATHQDLDNFVRNRRVRGLIVGPGWMQQHLDASWIASLRQLQSELDLRIIFDAGATAGLATLLHTAPLIPKLTVATPHPGEWSKIFDQLVSVQSLDDFSAVFDEADRCGLSLLYKSATPLLFQSDDAQKLAWVITGGSGAVAKAGAGDILCGVIATHAIHCNDIAEATIYALRQFYRAGRIAALQRGYHGVLPSDILSHLSLAD